MRADLPLGPLAAQLSHAAGESSPGNLPKDTHVVVLAAASEDQLLHTARRLEARAVDHVVIREPDPPFCGAATAIGIRPVVDRKPVRRAVDRLKLLE